MKKIALIILLLLGLIGGIKAQPYYFKQYQSENGLSNNTVICCLQDRKGFLWFGTKDGLNRFDGYTFKIYRNNPDDPKSLGNNLVHTLYEDTDGKIWVGTENGIYKYDPETESFSVLKTAASGEILNIIKDAKGNIWYIANKKIFKLTKSSGIIKFYNINNCLVTSVCLTPAGNIWLSSSSGNIYQYDEGTDLFKGYNIFNHSAQVQSGWIVKIYGAGRQSILVGTANQGLKIFNTVNHTYVDLLTQNPDHTGIFIRDILRYKKNEFWLATESGIYIYNISTHTFINLKKQINDPYSLSYNSVYCLFKDKEGGLWAGTYFGGVNNYSPQYALFKKYFPQNNSNSLSGTAIRRICKDMYGNMWIGTEDGGLNKLDRKTGTFTNFKPTGDKNSLSYSNIHGLLAIGNKLWIGTFEYGLDVMDIKTGKIIKHYQINNKTHPLESNFIICVYQTRSKDIYIGTGYGLYRYDKASDDFVFIHNDHIQAIEEDKKGIIWAGAHESGIFSFDPKTKHIENLKNEILHVNSLNGNVVNGIFEDSNEELWFTTENGLYELNKNRTKYERYSSLNGLPGNVTFSILEDDNKNLWISTSSGLVCMNLATKKTITFTKENGLLTNQFNYDSAYKDDDGNMYFGSVKGLISFNPSAFISNSYTSPVYITGFQVNNQELKIGDNNSPLKKSIISTRHISLKYNQSSFSIDFAALNFTSPEMLQYAYRMTGIDKEWTVLKMNRKVYFTNLSPGKYVFEVKAKNGRGVGYQPSTKLIVDVTPPFWASYYAFFLYLTIAGVAVYYLIRKNQLRHEEKNRRKFEIFENKKEREIYNAKIEFFTHVTHEIRTPLTLIKGPLENIIQKNDLSPAIQTDLKLVEKNTNRLLDLTNQLLDFRKVESRGLSLNFVRINISEFLGNIYIGFKSLAVQKDQKIEMELTEQLYADADADALHKIIDNLFTNAIKYADKEIYIRLYVVNGNFIIEIKNDGHIIQQELREKIFEPFFRVPETNKQQGSGIGLALCRSLAELHNGTLRFESTNTNFNTFILSLPVHQTDTFTFYEKEPETIVDLHETNQFDPYKPLVLIVEDNLEISNFLFSTLINNYSVVSTSNGQQALDILKEKTVQLILSDVVMPGMDGFELCKIVKTTIEFSHIPIVLLTAKSALQSKIEGLESGADAYIEKPFSPEHLLVQVSNLLKNRDSIKMHFANSPLIHIKSIAYSKADEIFLEKLNNAILENMTNEDLDVDHLAEIMYMSRPTLYRKIKAISNLTPNELINIARLKKAAELLAAGDLKICEIANMVGYASQTYFGHNFFKQFGMPPSEYANIKREERKAPIS